MGSYANQVRRNNLLNQGGLDTNVPKAPQTKTVVKYVNNGCSSSSGCSTGLSIALGATAIAAAALPMVSIFAMMGGSRGASGGDGFAAGGAQGAQGAGFSGNTKAVMGLLDNAEESHDLKRINPAIEQGNKEAQGLDKTIQGLTQSVKDSETTITNIKGNIDKKTGEVKQLKDGLSGLKKSVEGENSSKKLTGKQNDLKSQLAKVKDDPENPGVAEAQRRQLQSQIDALTPQIENAKNIEEKQIPDQEKKIKEAEQALEDYKTNLDKETEKLDAAKKQLETATENRKNIGTKIERLKQEKANIEASTKPVDGGTTAPATPAASATPTADANAGATGAVTGAAQAATGAAAAVTGATTGAGAQGTANEGFNLMVTSSNSRLTSATTSSSLKLLIDDIDRFISDPTNNLTPAQKTELESIKTQATTKKAELERQEQQASHPAGQTPAAN